MHHSYDLAIIGGGINGCGIARDAAGRGLAVFLCEAGDLSEGTSSRSTKLIHGGLRYLEHFDFRLVREALTEREVLWAMAPHIVRPMRFVLPHQKGLRPAWMLRMGLFIYDHLGGRHRLPATRVIDLTTDAAGAPLQPGLFSSGFEYSDCWVDDARLVVLNARDAANRGAQIRVRTTARSAKRAAGLWQLTVEDSSGCQETIAARILVNAAGPWVARVLSDIQIGGSPGIGAPTEVRLVQGSHIVVRKLFDHDRAYLFQNPDRRVVFAIPYERDFTLIGTTDRDFTGDPATVAISADEIAYLCATASRCFARAVAPADVVWTYTGVRSLHDDGTSDAKAASRDYVFELDEGAGGAPLLSIIGGKITTYRRLAEAALERLKHHLPGHQGLAAGWTGHQPLPGGAFAVDALAALIDGLVRDYPFLTLEHAQRLGHAYGTTARQILGKARSAQELGRHFGATLMEAEVAHLMANEWASTAADVAWRRSKLGLKMTSQELAALDAWMAERAAPIAAACSAAAKQPAPGAG